MTISAEKQDLLAIRRSATHVWVDQIALRRWLASCSLEIFRFSCPDHRQAYRMENASMLLMIHAELGQSQDNGKKGSVQR